MADREISALASLRDSYDQLAAATLGRLLSRPAVSRGGEAWQRQIRDLLDVVEPRHLTHVQLARLKRAGIAVPQALSFRAIMVQRFRTRQIDTADPSWRLDGKLTGYAFADQIGARRPKSDLTARPITEVEPAAPLVVKPRLSTGARGVYLCPATDRIVHLQDATKLHSWGAMREHAAELTADTQQPIADRWLTEELILERSGTPARDLKFYAFYGEIPLILEVVRHPEFRACWWTADGEQADVGKYGDKHLYESLGVTAAQIAEAAEISRQIPRAFMRIDMLAGADGLTVGEFTPRPGGFERFSGEWDRLLGEAWMRAEGQLIADLLDGKRFDAFTASTR